MTGSTMTAGSTTLAPRRLGLAPSARGSDTAARKVAVRRVREARRQLQASAERFAHLKRMYD
jgi:hypothetical protein